MSMATFLLAFSALATAGDSYCASLSAYDNDPPAYPILISIRRREGMGRFVDTHLRARSGEKTVDLPHVRWYEYWPRMVTLWSSLLLLPPEEWSLELFLEMRDGRLVEVELDLPLHIRSNPFRGCGPLNEKELAILDMLAWKGGDWGNHYRLGLLRGIRPEYVVERKMHWELQKGNLAEALACYLAVEITGSVGTRAPTPNLEQILFCASPEEAMSVVPRVVELARQIAPEKEGKPYMPRFSESREEVAELDFAREARRFIRRMHRGKGTVEILSQRGQVELKHFGAELASWAGAADHLCASDGRLLRDMAAEILERETGLKTPPGLTPEQTGAYWQERIGERYEFFVPPEGVRTSRLARPSISVIASEGRRAWWRTFAFGLGAGVVLAVLSYLTVRLVRRALARRK